MDKIKNVLYYTFFCIIFMVLFLFNTIQGTPYYKVIFIGILGALIGFSVGFIIKLLIKLSKNVK